MMEVARAAQALAPRVAPPFLDKEIPVLTVNHQLNILRIG
jgi:hypothetical protein